MIAKRFQWVFIKDNELELKDNGIIKRFNNERLEELLNVLHEENIQYKRELDNIYLLIGKGDWSGLVDLLIYDEKCKIKSVKNVK